MSSVLSDSVTDSPPDRLLYWLLQYCTFDGLTACRSELRCLLFDASERQLQSEVDRLLSQRATVATGSESDRQSLYAALSAPRDTAMAAVDFEVALRVKLRHLYRSIVDCSYEHAMGLSSWLTQLRDECDSAGLPLTSASPLFHLQLLAIGNIAVRAADRPRTSKADFDTLMQHLMTYAAITHRQYTIRRRERQRTASPRSAAVWRERCSAHIACCVVRRLCCICSRRPCKCPQARYGAAEGGAGRRATGRLQTNHTRRLPVSQTHTQPLTHLNMRRAAAVSDGC